MQDCKKQIVSIRNNERLLTIKWRLTTWCNYRCSYCIQWWGKKNEKTDFNRLFSTAKEINRLIESSPRPVKLYLLGGEVTWYDLEKLVSAIQSKKLAKIAITTNFSNSTDYYISFANYLHSRGVKLGMCCSLHKEYVTPAEFVKKAADVKRKTGLDAIKIEFVLNPETESLADEIKRLCEEESVDYRFDYDKTQDDAYRSQGKNVSKDSHPRYTITFDDGSVDKTLTQNQLLNYQNGQTKDSKFNTEGFYCTRGMSYFYIDVDMVGEHNICFPRESYVPISEYRIKTEPQLCHKQYCSLSGDISLARHKEDIDF